ncbi:MAG: biotin/lipoyl-binding protein, partial [Pirellulaceae bacterium]
QRRDLQTFAVHAEKALLNAETFERVPWARVASALASRSSHAAFAVRRQWLMAGFLAILVAVIACFPIPLIVHSEGELYAANTQAVYAPRDGVVTDVLVEHGQAVKADQVLLRMTDQRLEEQYESLVGERAVLLQRGAEIRGALLGQSTRHREESQRLQAEQRIVSEKMSAVDRQLALLDHERNRLTLRSDRDGVVDGWQIRRNLIERPVQRGDPLLNVIEPNGSWRVETRLPQNRVDLVLAAIRAVDARAAEGTTTARFHRVALASAPDKLLLAEFEQMGPIVHPDTNEGPVAKTSFLIAGQSLPDIQTGAPATVAIDCGYRPLLFVAFQDFIRTVTGKLRMYL